MKLVSPLSNENWCPSPPLPKRQHCPIPNCKDNDGYGFLDTTVLQDHHWIAHEIPKLAPPEPEFARDEFKPTPTTIFWQPITPEVTQVPTIYGITWDIKGCAENLWIASVLAWTGDGAGSS